MKKRCLVTALLAMFLLIVNASSVMAAGIWSDTYTAADTTVRGVSIDGDYLVATALTVEGSFSGWGDLSGYTDVTATMTFTWHDDDNLNYSMYGEYISSDHSNWDTENDTTGSPAYPDLAAVSLDGTTVFEEVEVGITNSTDPSTYIYTLTDLSLLDDGELTYLVEAMKSGSARTDFVLDSITLSIEGTSSVPVPGALWLLGSGLLGLAGLRRKHADRS